MSFESFVGAIWFSGLTALVGYIAGHLFPITKLKSLFSRD